MKKQTRVWTSDGADRDVFSAARAVFPGLLFEAWDESHSGVKLLQKALDDDPEIKKVDELLVTGKKQPVWRNSLARRTSSARNSRTRRPPQSKQHGSRISDGRPRGFKAELDLMLANVAAGKPFGLQSHLRLLLQIPSAVPWRRCI